MVWTVLTSDYAHSQYHDPRFKALAERVEDLKNRHDQKLLVSVEFLQELRNFAKDVVEIERAAPRIEEDERDAST